MSLADAILEIAADMEGLSKRDERIELCLVSFATQLRRAVKAAEGSPPSPQGSGVLFSAPAPIDPLVAHRLNIERAKGERLTTAANREDAEGEVSVRCAGGSLDRTMVTLPGLPPVGAFVPQGGEVYQYGEDRVLHYHPAQTKRFLKERGKR